MFYRFRLDLSELKRAMDSLHTHSLPGALPPVVSALTVGDANVLRSIVNAAFNKDSCEAYQNVLDQVATLYYFIVDRRNIVLITNELIRRMIDCVSGFTSFYPLLHVGKHIRVYVHDTRWRTVDIVVQPFALLQNSNDETAC